MPLHDGAAARIRQQLQDIRDGLRVSVIAIGRLTPEQHGAVHAFRKSRGLTGGESPEIVYVGRHHFTSRMQQGYTIDDLVLQAEASLAADAVPQVRGSMTSLRSVRDRDDGYGNKVRDLAVFELSVWKPRIELFSVIPKGDRR
jgi:hypothetical protein